VTRPAATLLVLVALALACGKYGPPVRAGQARAAKPAPQLEVPLPAPPAAAEPAPAPDVELEQEPPPEGAP
jgi:hypothetical protein